MNVAVIIPHFNGINNLLVNSILQKFKINLYSYSDIAKIIPAADIYCVPWFKKDNKNIKKILMYENVLVSTDCTALYKFKEQYTEKLLSLYSSVIEEELALSA
jgi:hypothetical protein